LGEGVSPDPWGWTTKFFSSVLKRVRDGGGGVLDALYLALRKATPGPTFFSLPGNRSRPGRGAELTLVDYQGKCRLIRGWDELFAKAGEHSNSVAAMKMSPYFKEFEACAIRN